MAGITIELTNRCNLRYEPEPEMTIEPQPMKLAIVFEDDDVIILDKPAGVVVHPARGNRDHTLVNGLLYHCKSLPLRKDSLTRPGVVHRLDKETTGLLMFAKNDIALRSLGSQIEHRTVVREYAAFAWGDFECDEGTVDAPIGPVPYRFPATVHAYRPDGRPSVSHVRVVRRFPDENAALLEVTIPTGRPHQIRIHLSYAGFPLVGDPLYRSGGVPRAADEDGERAALPGRNRQSCQHQ